MTYFYKKFMPINQIDKFLCFGIPSSKNYIEVDANIKNTILVEQLINRGAQEEDVFSIPLYKLLLDNKLLTKTESSTSNEDLNRNDLYTEYMLGRSLTKQEKLSAILILGAGAGGSTLCYQLCQLGFESIIIVDVDKVEESDVSKSMIFDTSAIGKSKVSALKEKIYNQFNLKLKIYDEDLTSFDKLKNIRKNNNRTANNVYSLWRVKC